MKPIKIMMLFLCIVSCAPIYVNYDYEKSTDFSKYKTYNYFSNMETGLSELDEKRFLKILSQTLESKGILRSETPDFLIDIKSNEYEENSRSTVGVGVGGSGRNVGGGISIGIPVGQSKVSRQIVIDFVDQSNNSLFWQANSESNFNPDASPEEREARFKSISDKILVKYPPKSK